MGCDIHMYVEHKSKRNNNWYGFGGRINPGRIYGMFAKLADVRNEFGILPIAPPRGIPADLGSEAFEDYTMYISDTPGEGYVTPERARNWLDNESSVLVREHFISNPDWHSASWCTVEELEQAITDVWKKGYNGNEIEWKVLVTVGKSFQEQGEDVRFVFWFDN